MMKREGEMVESDRVSEQERRQEKQNMFENTNKANGLRTVTVINFSNACGGLYGHSLPLVPFYSDRSGKFSRHVQSKLGWESI